MNEELKLNRQEVESVIATLKQIKPHGFKSMDRVVGLVLFFENKMREAAREQEETPFTPLPVKNDQTEVT